MPRLLLVAALIAAGYYAWRVAKREMARVGRELDKARGLPTETLTQDPKTGRYRVSDRK